MNKKLVTNYVFNTTAGTVASPEFVDITKIAAIVNLTTGQIMYNPARPTLGGTLANGVLTLDIAMTGMADTDLLQIFLHTGTELERIGFTKAISNGVDTGFFNPVVIGSGMTVNQTGGELVITSGTTARAETIIRSKRGFTGGIRARITSRLSQRIVNQQFIYEMVDVIGDGLAYTINSATSITVTFPTTYVPSTEDVGRSVTLQQFSGSGTFLSGRYVIASVSGQNVTITVAGFAVGTGTVSVVGLNAYRLLYDGATATSANFDIARGGYLWSQKPGATNVATYTSATSAAPGHQAIITANDGVAFLHDTLTANSTVASLAERAKRITNIPDDLRLFLQIRVINLGTAPASTTTWNIEQVSVAYYEPTSVAIQDVRPTNFDSPMYVKNTTAGPTQPVSLASTTITAITAGVVQGATLGISTTVADVASAALTTTTTTAAFTPTAGVAYQPVVTVTAVTGTTPLLTVQVEESNDGGVNWFPRYPVPFVIGATQSATTTAVGQYNLPPLMGTGNRVRYVQTVTGTTPSITRSIGRNQLQSEIGTGMPYSLVSAATTNAALVKTGPTFITSLGGGNINAAVRYLKLYDKASAPTVGTDPVAHTYILPGATTGGGSNIPLNKALYFGRGLGIALTTGVLASDTGAVAANEITVNATIS